MSYTPKNNFNLKMIKIGDTIPIYTPENNSNLQLKRTGAGEVGFRKKLWKTVVNTCDDPEYYFRLVPKQDSFYKNDSQEVEVVGGVGDFSWSISGSGFSLADATTSGRTNTVSTDGTVGPNDSAVLTVVDSCGTSVSGNLKVCYNISAPITIYDEWSTCGTVLDSLYCGRLVGVEQIGELLYLIVASGDYWHLYSWNGSASNLTGIITDWNVEIGYTGMPPLTTLIGNTIYVGTRINRDMLSWTLGDANWTRHTDLGRKLLINHQDTLMSAHLVSVPGALYSFGGDSWSEEAEFLDNIPSFFSPQKMLSLDSGIYVGGYGSYPGSEYELRKYVAGEGTPEDPHDMKICITEHTDEVSVFSQLAEMDDYIYTINYSGGRLYRGLPSVGSPPALAALANAPGGSSFSLIKHGTYMFGLNSSLSLYRWKSGDTSWTLSASIGGELVHEIPFTFKNRLYAAISRWEGQKFCIVRWGA